MTKDKETEDGQLSAYESMIKERLVMLKESLDDTYEKGDTEDDKSSKLVSCIMTHLANVYTRLDIALGEIERLSEAYLKVKSHLDDEMEAMKIADSQDEYLTAKSDFEKELAKEQESPA